MPAREVVICTPVRTAIGTYGGSLKATRPPRSARRPSRPFSTDPDSTRQRSARSSSATSYKPEIG